MQVKTLHSLDAVEQANMVRSKQVSPLDLVDAAIARIEQFNPVINALASYDFERARKCARAHPTDGLFAGVPTLVKDLLPYPQLTVEFGSRVFKGNVAQEGSDYATAIDRGGLIVLGKSATSEFGLLGTTESLANGPTRNPWNSLLSPGGSSGGAVAAVASGMVPIAHASDGGGSIRGPASFCGLFGFKPSRGRTVSAGIPDTMPTSRLLSEHCVSRSVRDSATWLTMTETASAALTNPIALSKRSINPRLRIGFYTNDNFGRKPHADVILALNHAIQLCAALGHHVEETSGPQYNADAVSQAFFNLTSLVISGMFEQLHSSMGASFQDTLAEPYTRDLVAYARRPPMHQVAQQISILDDAQRAAELEMSKFDVLLSPTVPIPGFALGSVGPTANTSDLIEFTKRIAGYTVTASLAGWSAMSVPLYWTSDGMPIGCHFAAANGQDSVLFDLAFQLEEAEPWQHWWPVGFS
jgi:amidase